MSEDFVVPKFPKRWASLDFNSAFFSPKGQLVKVKQKDTLGNGEIPVVDQGQEFISGYTKRSNKYFGPNPAIIFGDHTLKIKYVDFDFAVGADGTKVLHPIDSYLPKFIYYYLKSVQIYSKGYSRHYKVLKQVPIPVLSLDEQKRIVKKLDTIFEQLNETKARLDRVPDLLKKFRQSVLDAAFLTKSGEVLDTKPNNWQIKTLGEIVESQQIGVVRAASIQGNDRQYPYLKMGDYDENGNLFLNSLTKVDATENEVAKYSLKEGDLIFNTRNSPKLVGKVAIIPSEMPVNLLYNNNLMRLRFPDEISPQFIYNQFFTGFVRKQLAGLVNATTSVAAIYGKKLFEVKFLVPPLEVQSDVNEVINRQLAPAKDYAAICEQNLELLNKVESAVLKQAFEGRLVEQDPNDEPASVLLERIQAEREAAKPKKKVKKA